MYSKKYHNLVRTRIHTTKKLEKLIKNLLITKTDSEEGLLGKWNATVFYVSRKKCFLFTNGLTKYNVILGDVKASDYKHLEENFLTALHAQLNYDGIELTAERLEKIVGGLDFLPTDNDRKTIGFQNANLETFKWWIAEYRSLENMNLNKLTNTLNRVLIHIGESKKMADFTKAVDEMKSLLKDEIS